MNTVLSVAALVSAGRHPSSGAPRACRGDAVAMALGQSLAGNSLRVLHAGSEFEPGLRDYLAYGAATIEVVPVREGDDFAVPLAGAVCDADIILTGARAEQGAGSGLLPYLIGETLARPVIANVLNVSVQNGEVRVQQFLPKGQRRQISCPFPIVAVVHPLAPVRLQYAFSRRISGRIETLAAGGMRTCPIQPSWAVESASRSPVRLKALEKKAGHARLLSAIASEAKSGVVAFEGTTVDKAQVVLNYLREHRLIDF